MRSLLIVLIVFSLSACGAGSYQSLYSNYTAACSLPQNQNIIEVPQASSRTLKINQGCSLTAPVDADAKWVAMGTALGVALIRGGVTYGTSRHNRDIMTEAFRQAGPKIGGDGVIGGRDASMLDQTAEPFIIEIEPLPPIPEPVAVP